MADPSKATLADTENVWTDVEREYPRSSTARILKETEDSLQKGRTVGGNFTPAFIVSGIERVSRADIKNVQEIAGSQLELLSGYHQIALNQSQKSFFWALIGSGAGLLLFLLASSFVLYAQDKSSATIPAISGAIVEAMAGIVFYLYGKTTTQLGEFHHRLEQLQRHLLANSICESLNEQTRDKVRGDLVREIARISAGTE